jgi:Microcystin-dependent protein
MDPFLSQILLWSLNWAPQDWHACDGTSLSVSQNNALYALLGNVYGGNTSNFNLPDFRGRVPLGYNPYNNIGLSMYDMGTKGGVEAVALTQNNLAAHTHTAAVSASAISVTIKASSAAGTDNVPGTNNSTTLAASMSGRAAGSFIYNNQAPTVALNTASSVTGGFTVTNSVTGANVAHENRQPYLVVNFIIATAGIFPIRP